MKNDTENGETQNGQHRANPLEVAWLAGIVDGEGSINARWIKGRDKSYKHVGCRVQICNTDMRIMNECQRVIQLICHKKHSIRDMRMTYQAQARNRCFALEVASQRLVWILLEALLPHLRGNKKSQALAVIHFCESRKLDAHRGSGYTRDEWDLPNQLRRIRKCGMSGLAGGVQTERVAPLTEAQCMEFLLSA